MGRTNAKVWWAAACAAMACAGEHAQAQPACDTLDYNRDGIVNDFADYASFVRAFTSGVPCPGCGDLNFNNEAGIDALDLFAFDSRRNGGPCITIAANNVQLTFFPFDCDDVDFNNDGIFPDQTDYAAFVSVLLGGPCIPEGSGCGDADFNNDGRINLFDLSAFATVLNEGNCFGGVVPGPVPAACEPRWEASFDAQNTIHTMTRWDQDGPGPLPQRVVLGTDSEDITGSRAISMWEPGSGVPYIPHFGSGINQPNAKVLALHVQTPSNQLLVGGSFSNVNNIANTANIARWNGQAWSSLGQGLNGQVRAITTWNNRVIAAGDFTTNSNGSTIVNRIAQLQTNAWTTMGLGMNRSVFALAPAPDGTLIAGGEFTTAGGAPALYVARWNGVSWSPVGGGIPGMPFFTTVRALLFLPNGDLLAGGRFEFVAPNGTAINVARWNGSAWLREDVDVSGLGEVVGLEQMANGDVLVTGKQGLARSRAGSWTYTPGTPYYGQIEASIELPDSDILVGGWFLGMDTLLTEATVRWRDPSLNPANALQFTQQPLSGTLCPIGSATIEAIASGQAAISYAWEFESSPGVWTMLVDGPFLGGGVVGSATSQLIISPIPPIGTSVRLRAVATSGCVSVPSNPATISVTTCSGGCDSIDFNNDGGFFDPTDIDAFLSVFSEGPCVPETATCNDIDFNNDQGLFDPCDIDSFLLVFSEGPCTSCGG